MTYKFAGVRNNMFYFEEVEEKGVEVDAFMKSDVCSINWLKNRDNGLLLINADGQFEFCSSFPQTDDASAEDVEVRGVTPSVPDVHRTVCPLITSSHVIIDASYVVRGPEAVARFQGWTAALCSGKFVIQPYNSSDLPCNMTPVTLGTKQEDGKNVVVCCSTDGRVFSEELDIPSDIDGSGHKALFYLRKVEGKRNTCMFESSLLRSHCLGFQPDGDSPFNKLVLRSVSDKVDEFAHICMVPCDN